MPKETKSEYFHFKLAPSLKKRIYERSAELNKEPAVYVRDLIEKDCSSFDMTESEKPRMKEFAQVVANEFNRNLEIYLSKGIEGIAAKSDMNTAIACWSYRQVLNTFVNLAKRINTVGSLKEEDLKTINEESAKTVNSMFDKFLDAALTKSAESIFDYLKKPI